MNYAVLRMQQLMDSSTYDYPPTAHLVPEIKSYDLMLDFLDHIPVWDIMDIVMVVSIMIVHDDDDELYFALYEVENDINIDMGRHGIKAYSFNTATDFIPYDSPTFETDVAAWLRFQQ